MGVNYTGKFGKLVGVKNTKGVPPLWITLPALNFAEGEAVDLNLVAQALDPEAGEITYTLISGELPDGLTLTNAGRLFGTVSYEVISSYTFTVEASDTKSTATRTFHANVSDTNRAPVWSTAAGSLGEIDEGLEITPITLVATDADAGDTLTYEVTSGALPEGLTLSTAGVISGIAPSVSSDTVSNFTVTVTDSHGGTAERAFTLTTKFVNQVPVWSTAPGSLGSFTEGATLAPITLVASDADAGDTLTYAVTSGSLPAGLNLSTAGVISGTLSGVTGGTTSTFTVTVTDSHGGSSARSFSITVLVSAVPVKWAVNREGAIILNNAPNETVTTNGASAGGYGVFTNALPATGQYYFDVNIFEGYSTAVMFLGLSNVTTAFTYSTGANYKAWYWSGSWYGDSPTIAVGDGSALVTGTYRIAVDRTNNRFYMRRISGTPSSIRSATIPAAQGANIYGMLMTQSGFKTTGATIVNGQLYTGLGGLA